MLLASPDGIRDAERSGRSFLPLRNRANCLRRKRFSAASADRGRRLSLMKLRKSDHKSKMVNSFGQRIEVRHQQQDRTSGTRFITRGHEMGMNRDVQNYCGPQG